MADKNLLSQMLEHLVNEDQAKAEELFHEYVVAASREIYEGLIESELKDEEEDEDKVDEAAEEDEDKDDEDLDENFEDIAVEADDEMDMDADPTDDLTGELDAEEDEEGEEGEEQLFQDLEAIVDELQAKFDELKGDDHEEPDADNMGGPSDMDADNMPGGMDGVSKAQGDLDNDGDHDMDDHDMEKDDKKKDEWVNEPDEEIKDIDYMVNKLAGGMNRPQGTHPKVAGGDNPMQKVESVDLKTSIKNELRNRLAEAKLLNKRGDK
jgi:hypothetical protein